MVGSEIAVEINMARAYYAEKVPFYLSESNIILSPGIGDKGTIPPKYIR